MHWFVIKGVSQQGCVPEKGLFRLNNLIRGSGKNVKSNKRRGNNNKGDGEF